MIYCVNHETIHQFGGLLVSNFRLRYRMCVDGQYWDVPRYKGMEYDQYDTPATTHLVWVDDKGEVRGSVRTAPTDRPYMIKDLWPEMVPENQLPNSMSVWEASRFCVDHTLPSDARQRVKQELICSFLEFGLQNDIREMIGVMPEKFWNSCFINNGWDIEFLGQEKLVETGDRIIAGRMPINLHTLKRVREVTGIEGHILRLNKNAVLKRMPAINKISRLPRREVA